MKTLSVIGTRPQFIKYAPLRRHLKDDILVHTGQHYDHLLSRVFFDQLGIPDPDYNLNVGSLTQNKQIGQMMERLDDVLMDEQPGMVLVFGDTNSTLAGSLASVKQGIPVAHIEAGLRSFDRSMPEELNRVVTDHVSSLLFAPTGNAVGLLHREGITCGVHLVGDIMADALKENLRVAKESSILSTLRLQPGGYHLATVHRPSNTDDPTHLKGIMEAFSRSDVPVVFPVHPRTEHAMRRYGIKPSGNLRLIDPVGYFDFLWLEKNCCKILTDSGGIQKEAYLLGKPCITLRDSTEWVETIEEGWNLLVGADTTKIITAIHTFNPITKQKDVFGEGDTCQKIIRYVNAA